MAITIEAFRITGTSPLMQNNPVEFIGKGDDNGLQTKKVYNDEDEAALRTYKNDSGQFIHPTTAFRNCMMKAVSGRKFGKKAARMVIAAAVYPAETECVILDGKGKPAKEYVIDKRPVVIGKARVLRCRPKFFPWSMSLPLELDTELISAEQVLEALQLAGRIIGIGDYRPDPSNGKSGIGDHGRFKVELV